jgi:benzoate-CoA ligase family protein
VAGAKNLAGEILDGAIAKGWGERVAIQDSEVAWTYAETRDFAARLGAGLRALGLSPGARVAVVMPDSVRAAAAILGAIYGGYTTVPLSELGRPSDLRDLLNDSGAEAVIVRDELEPAIDEVRSEIAAVRAVIVAGQAPPGATSLDEIIAGEPLASAAPADEADVALLLYSAGVRAHRPVGGPDPTAGGLVGVPHHHQTPHRAYASLAQGGLGLDEADRVFSVVRVSTAYGLGSGVLFPLIAGGQSILLPEQPRSEPIFEVIRRLSPTVLVATPSIYRQLAMDAEAHNLSAPLAGIRLCLAGAEETPAQVIERASHALGVQLMVGYGATEAFQFVLAGQVGAERSGACGRPLPGFEVQVVDDGGQPVGPDEIGTLMVRGQTIVHHYWGESATDIGERWFATRDRFLVAADGTYYHCGRSDDLFKVGGRWVAPSEVERALLAHEAVWECAVIGAEDADGLTVPVAFVVPNIGHAPSEELASELSDYVKSVLTPYKYPRSIDFVDRLPRGPTGKLLRYKLRASERRRS